MPLVTSYTDQWGQTHPASWIYCATSNFSWDGKIAHLEFWVYTSKVDAYAGRPPIAKQSIDLTPGGTPAGDSPAVPSFGEVLASNAEAYGSLEASLSALAVQVLPELAGATWEPVDPV